MQKSKLEFKTQSLKFIIIAVGVVLLAAGCSWRVNNANPQTQEQRQQIQVVQKVEGQLGDKLFNFYEDEQKTALDLLEMTNKVESKEFSGAGKFVESIDGVKPDSKHFWAFYLNGKQAEVGASAYKPVNGDTIEWKLEEIKN